ncbi:MAG: acyl-CoA thioesterase/bile acid-CoA:amino acid N-acyltransferase family protein [Pseudomonadota bacterium]
MSFQVLGRVVATIAFLNVFLLANTPAQPAELSVTPPSRLWMEDYRIRVAGVPPGAEVVIEAQMRDMHGKIWSSHGTYFASPGGDVNPAEMASLIGTYKGTDARGLIWSMLPLTTEDLDQCAAPGCIAQDAPRMPHFDVTLPTKIQFTAKIADASEPGGVESLDAEQVVGHLAPGVTRKSIEEAPLRGLLFKPAANVPMPAVLYIGGSAGGAEEAAPALLASHGFAVLSIAYFNYPDRPEMLANIPLEYFETGIRFLRQRFKQTRIGVIGVSRGSEAALLTAARVPDEVGALILGVPSNVIWGGCCTAEASTMPAWTWRGEPLAFTPDPPAPRDPLPLDLADRQGGTSFRRYFLPGFVDDGRSFSKAIDVSAVDAPVLVLSGQADQIWPSAIAGALIHRRLDAVGTKHEVTHIAYEGAGHLIMVPSPVTSLQHKTINHATGAALEMGGVPHLNAAATIAAFREQVAFLKRHLLPVDNGQAR